ncbi:hypothetical protein HMPREF9723_01236 [Treponema denticola OTK]|uniref:Uncharacterized protein n=1 Tax=Treponema denticola OTK TaxID=999434 RepID=A0A0F6MNR8_TREDN|nr:hypothetical protein HMPREF9723_01236 [Treponema denticola OTK]
MIMSAKKSGMIYLIRLLMRNLLLWGMGKATVHVMR